MYVFHEVYANPKEKESEEILLFNEELIEKNNEPVLNRFIQEQREQEEINSIQQTLEQRGSPLAPYAGVIYKQAQACGGDYRVLLGIAGNESNLGQVNYKLYNPYGYLNGVQYASYEEALTILSCEISQLFLAPCNNDLSCIIASYGGPDTDQEKWIRDAQFFINLF